MFLGAHFVWAFSLMFLFSGRGYWQELIESIIWAHKVVVIQGRALPTRRPYLSIRKQAARTLGSLAHCSDVLRMFKLQAVGCIRSGQEQSKGKGVAAISTEKVHCPESGVVRKHTSYTSCRSFTECFQLALRRYRFRDGCNAGCSWFQIAENTIAKIQIGNMYSRSLGQAGSPYVLWPNPLPS